MTQSNIFYLGIFAFIMWFIIVGMILTFIDRMSRKDQKIITLLDLVTAIDERIDERIDEQLDNE